MQTKIIFATIFLASLLLFSSSVLADIYIRPAKLGIIRLTYQPLFPTVYQGTFDVGDTYNFSLNVTLSADQNVSSILTLSDANFTLQPNETRTVSFLIKPNAAGVYSGEVDIVFSSVNYPTNVAYANTIVIIVSQSNSYVLILVAVAVVVVIIAASLFVLKTKKARMKK
jgi:hypothetical protein